VPQGMQNFATRVPIEGWTWNAAKGWYVGATPLFVDVLANLDLEAGVLSWSLLACDATTGEWPEDAFSGFLPPNDPAHGAGSGQGFVTFSVRPRNDLPSGEVITNSARIVFDFNPPIDTPPVSLILDAAAPTSSVRPFAHQTTWEKAFTVAWGEDGTPDNSGVSGFEVYVSVDGKDYGLWTATDAHAALFTGEPTHTYSFYSVARDNVGHVEEPPRGPGGIIQPDATIAVVLPRFVRGDANADNGVDIGDAITILGYLFGTTQDPSKAKVAQCFEAADANDSGALDIADAIAVLSHLFAHTGPLPEPSRECGVDRKVDNLGCRSFAPCSGR
jgi:hypothetical protein